MTSAVILTSEDESRNSSPIMVPNINETDDLENLKVCLTFLFKDQVYKKVSVI